MSSTYNLEPPPTAKVLLHTTSGDIELEIFAKQTPLTSRNFLQHCIDGYYDGTVFHRLVPGFVLQGGDPTGTGDGGDSIYPDGPFADEFHSRLKFNRRGLLGMANTGRKNDNGSQFFLTLGKTEELTGKNTMFGRVAGDTIYNVMRMGEAELMEAEGSERPLYPTKITSAEVLLNPFPDVVKREIKPQPAQLAPKLPAKKKAKKPQGKNLLSFEGDDEEATAEPLPKRAKFNTNLVVGTTSADDQISKPQPAPTGRKDKSIRTKMNRSPSPLAATTARSPEPQSQLPLPDDEKPAAGIGSSTPSPEPEQVKRVSKVLDRTNAQIAELKASMKRNIAPAASESTTKKSMLDEMIPVTAIRGRKRRQGKENTNTGEEESLKLFEAFRAKLVQAPAEDVDVQTEQDNVAAADEKVGAEDGEEGDLCDLHFIANCQSCKAWDKDGPNDEAEELNDRSWMSHSLNFKKDKLGKDLTWKQQNEDDLVVIDPREKAQSLRKEHRSRRDDDDDRRGGDRSRRAYEDRDRRERGPRRHREGDRDDDHHHHHHHQRHRHYRDTSGDRNGRHRK